MYIPDQFAEHELADMHQLIRDYPLATVVTLSEGSLNSNHIPLHLSASSGAYGRLSGHIARANPILRDIENASIETLVIFQGPNAYISPSWYRTKGETGKVVPAWNYAVVHAYGMFRIVEDTEWLLRQLEALTLQQEAVFSEPWTIADAPDNFITKIASAIVGIEMVITQLKGKWKVSQNQPEQNQLSVMHGLRESGLPNALLMATLVEQKMLKAQ